MKRVLRDGQRSALLAIEGPPADRLADVELVRLALVLTDALAGYGPAGPGAPPSARGLAWWPFVERWAALVAPLADVDDVEMELAGLRARRWLVDVADDRRRQQEAAAALGLAWPDLAAAAERAVADVVGLLALTAVGGRGLRPGDFIATDRALLAERGLWALDAALRGDASPALACIVDVVLRATERPWRWCWERQDTGDERPVVFPSDWRASWGDVHRLGYRRSAGAVLVVAPQDLPIRVQRVEVVQHPPTPPVAELAAPEAVEGLARSLPTTKPMGSVLPTAELAAPGVPVHYDPVALAAYLGLDQ